MRFRTLATIIGVALGTASLTASFNFSETAQRELMKEIRAFKTDIISWSNITSSQESNRDKTNLLSVQDAKKMEASIPEISSCTPIQQSGFLIRSYNSKKYVSLYGVNAGFSTILQLNLKAGRDIAPLEMLLEKNVCVIGHETAVFLYKQPASAIGQTLNIYNQSFLVVGVIEKNQLSAYMDVSNGVYIPHSSFLMLTSFKDAPRMVICRVHDPEKTKIAMEKANDLLIKSHGVNNFSSFVQSEIIEKQKKMISTINWLIKTVSFLTLLVACIGCSNIMIVAVNERIREIGLRMALGASRINILNMFMVEGIFLVISGGVIGIIGGYVLTQKLLEPLPGLISGYSGWEFKFYGESVVKSLGVLAVTAILSSLLPAWRAASKDPSQALRDN